jgi:PAS domain S-box-containing protein/diguanylate cyclase (GGDEF)-like protein
MTETYRIILVEDSTTDAELELHALRRAGIQFVPEIVETEDAFRNAAIGFDADIIISDYSLPNFDGMSALRIARDLCPAVPFIFVSGTIGEESAVAALRNGAADYVLKSNLKRFPAAVERAIQEARDRLARSQSERALAASQERFRTIVESTNEWIWETDPDGIMTYNNPAVEGILGYAPAEILGRNATSLLDQGEAADYATTLLGRREDRSPWHGVVRRWLHVDGSLRWLESNGMPIYDEDGRLAGFRGTDRDITERVLQHEKVMRLSRIRELTGEVNAAVTRHRDRNSLLAEICRISVEVGNLRAAWSGVMDDARVAICPIAWQGVDDDFAGIQPVPLDAEPGSIDLAVLAATGGKPVVENHVPTGPLGAKWKNKALARGFQSGIGLPLKSGGTTMGVLVLFSAEAHFFTPEEQRLFVDLAGDVSFAIESIEKQEQLDYLSYYDTLTGLPNRTLFLDRLGQVIDEARRTQLRAALAYLDIERMRVVNDSLGRATGDAVLREVGDRLQRTFKHNAISRIAMDRFAVAFPGLSSPIDAGRTVTEAMHATFSETFKIGDEELRIGATIGVSLFPDDGEDPEALLQNAETALKTAKSQQDTILFYTRSLNADVAERLKLETELRHAIEENQFILHFQPKVSLDSDRIEGLEALIRWQHPVHGLVPPAKFIPLLEETGLIIEVGGWALRSAASHYARWRDRGLTAPRIAVNVSAIELRQDSFVEDIAAVVSSENPGACGIDLEITESMVMRDLDQSVDILQQLRAMGIRIAIDDFGTGHSSLSYLARLPLDFLKIDRSFVARIPGSRNDIAIVLAIVSLARSLELQVVAEGVETEAQVRMLEQLGCDQAQGFFFSKPRPAEEIERLLRG